jgi:hypothetical protein
MIHQHHCPDCHENTHMMSARIATPNLMKRYLARIIKEHEPRDQHTIASRGCPEPAPDASESFGCRGYEVTGPFSRRRNATGARCCRMDPGA